MEREPSMQGLAQMINSIIGHNVLTEQQLKRIMQGAQKAHHQGGMGAVIDYLMKVTQADVDKQELTQFAEQVQSNPDVGREILRGKRNVRYTRKRK